MGAKRQNKRKAPPPGLADDMHDEVDAFHKDRELHFADDDEEGGAELDSDDDVEGVMNLSDSDNADSDEDLEAGGKLGKIIAAERALKRQLALQRGMEDEEDDEGEEADEDDTRQWGKKKGVYYDAEDVDVDFDSDDELAAEEAEEAQRLEKERAEKLDHAAFGLDEAATSSSDEEEDVDAKDGTLGATARDLDVVRSERIQKDIASMSDSEKEAAVLRDAPELAALLKDLSGSLRDVRQRIGPLLAELRKGGLATAEGISYLEAKHMLLLLYSIHIMFYMLLKLEGRQVREHPVIQRLVMIKAYLDKIRPIDKRLQSQIDKLVRAAELTASGQVAAANEDDPMSFRPNPGALVSQADENASDDGIYRPPKLTAMAMDDEPDSRREVAQAKRRQKAALRRAQQSDYVRELEAELTGAPEELRETGGGGIGDSIGLLKERQKLEARARVEEDMMTRVPLSKDERKRLKAQLRAGVSGQGLVDDFADDVAGVLDADKDNAIFFDKVRLGQKFGVDLSKERSAPVSGDADLLGKVGLAERRAKYDSLKARQQAQLEAMDAEMRSLKRPRVEDDFYTATKAAVKAKKQAKADKKHVPDLRPPLADPVSTEPRAITNEIQKNRGLTPHRRKDIKNPRKHNRVKFASAEKRRRGQVQSVKKSAGPYSGEATGIKSRVSKSTRF